MRMSPLLCGCLALVVFGHMVPVLRAAEPEIHWAFQPPVRPDVPAVANHSWCRNPIDAFILETLRGKRIAPAPEADRATLLRRVTYDLTGLLPTAQDLNDFLNDSRADAYDRVVERLLASPHYGERWAQHWLDLARYAESNGYEVDRERPHAFRYRDYVVRALNFDKSYARMVTEQLAGDLLARGGDRDPDLLLAVGFNRCGPHHMVGGNVDPVVLRQEFLTETTNAVGAVFLGLTFGCARCHDHKFDPLPQADYFKLQAFFNPVDARDLDLATAAEQETHRQATAGITAKIAPIKKQLDALEAPYRLKVSTAKRAALEPHFRTALDTPLLKRTPEQVKLVLQAQTLLKVSWDEVVEALSPEDRAIRTTLRRQMHDLESQRPPAPAQAWSLVEQANVPRKAHVLKRGDPHRKGEEVNAGFPEVLGGRTDEKFDRLELARWLTRSEHPLTARVMVNRLWQWHFGRGLVETPSDFGTRGAKPSHPALLDWLATELPRQGWSLKALHRLMVTSATYRQTSRHGDALAEQTDPDNRLLWRMNRRRMEAEGLRDCALQVAGNLCREVGGHSVLVPIEPEVYDLIFTEGEPDNLWQVTRDTRQHDRRSLYLFAKRNVRLPLLEAFDQPDTLTACPVRPVSTFAPQALHLLNGPFLHQQAQRFAGRLLREAGDEAMRIDLAYRLTLGRAPRVEEQAVAREFIREQREGILDRLLARLPVGVPPGLPEGADPALATALADFCLALLNSNEFVYVR